MQLIFHYPEELDSLELMLAVKAYENIWQSDGLQIQERFSYYTGLRFQQEEIEVIVHDAQSMSGKDGVPMHLNVRNNTIIKKRNALIHELAHRLLFGNGLYALNNTDPTDNDEIRVLLFQGDVINDLYGNIDYTYWKNIDSAEQNKDHLGDLHYALSLSKNERLKTIQKIITSQLKINHPVASHGV